MQNHTRTTSGTYLFQLEDTFMTIDHRKVITYAIAHMIVDFACAFLIFRFISDTTWWYLALLLYNFCAFALQMPLGLIADRVNKNALFAILGCSFVAIAYGFIPIPLLCVVIAGIGNALFHIGGGIEVLNMSEKKCAPLGIFVSPGALGIYLGTIFGKLDINDKLGNTLIIALVLALIVMVIAIFYFTFIPNHTLKSQNQPISFPSITSVDILIAILFLFLVVCLRSYVGMTLNFPWKGQGYNGLFLVIGVVLGKALGGILADFISPVKATVVSLILSSSLFLMFDYPVAGVIAILLFNMTMPITLWAMSHIFKGCKGFSFGLLTFGLFLGFLPKYFNVNNLVTTGVGFSLVALVSLLLLVISLKKAVI